MMIIFDLTRLSREVNSLNLHLIDSLTSKSFRIHNLQQARGKCYAFLTDDYQRQCFDEWELIRIIQDQLKLLKQTQIEKWYQYVFPGIVKYMENSYELLDLLGYDLEIDQEIIGNTRKQHILLSSKHDHSFGLSFQLRNGLESPDEFFTEMPTFQLIDFENHRYVMHSKDEILQYIINNPFDLQKEKRLRDLYETWEKCDLLFQNWSRDHDYEYWSPQTLTRDQSIFYQNLVGKKIKVNHQTAEITDAYDDRLTVIHEQRRSTIYLSKDVFEIF